MLLWRMRVFKTNFPMNRYTYCIQECGKSEILQLEWENVDLEQKLITILTQKKR